MYTRKQHLAGECSHHDYYASIASECGVSFKDSDMLPTICKAVGKDPNTPLNSIPLDRWDGLGSSLMFYNGATVREAFKKRGDYVTQAGLVCLLKAAAREAAK